ncbi:MAG: hypothetical protein RR565_09720 [Erysipelothrix sp.]
MPQINYAESYAKALAQAYPNVLHFAELWTSPNAGIAKLVDSNTVKIPHVTTTGRVDGDRETISGFKRNHDNEWLPKVLKNHRIWKTLIHPRDVQESGGVMAIQNATKVFNEDEKFPEMDAYCASAIFADWSKIMTAAGKSGADTTVPTIDNILDIVDKAMEEMDEANVPEGRIMYCTPKINRILKQAKAIQRIRNVENGTTAITSEISRIDELLIKKVPSKVMQTVFDFTLGWKKGTTAKQINMMFVHPTAVIPAINYTFAMLDEPSAKTEGKQLYFEESFEDMFVMDYKADGIRFNIEV